MYTDQAVFFFFFLPSWTWGVVLIERGSFDNKFQVFLSWPLYQSWFKGHWNKGADRVCALQTFLNGKHFCRDHVTVHHCWVCHPSGVICATPDQAIHDCEERIGMGNYLVPSSISSNTLLFNIWFAWNIVFWEISDIDVAESAIGNVIYPSFMNIQVHGCGTLCWPRQHYSYCHHCCHIGLPKRRKLMFVWPISGRVVHPTLCAWHTPTQPVALWLIWANWPQFFCATHLHSSQCSTDIDE